MHVSAAHPTAAFHLQMWHYLGCDHTGIFAAIEHLKKKKEIFNLSYFKCRPLEVELTSLRMCWTHYMGADLEELPEDAAQH